MARGNQRDLARERAQKKAKDSDKGQRQDGLKGVKMKEHDADIMRKKQEAALAKKEAEAAAAREAALAAKKK